MTSRLLYILITGVTGFITGSAIVAADASAATIAVDKACYVNAPPSQGALVTVTGSGFPAGDEIELESTGVFGLAKADATGAFSVQIQGPILPTIFPAASPFTLTANDESNPGPTATAPLSVANLAVQTKPSFATFNKKVSYTFSGFTASASIYGHYLHKGKVKATKRFGTASGACGQLAVKSLNYPSRRPPYSSYTVQFDDSSHYSKSSVPKIDTTLRLERF